jgi:predicted anti-sigma-YlaC factor YlaD
MAGSEEHLTPLRLFDLARQSGNQASEIEQEHLQQCEECSRIIEVFARQFNKTPKHMPEDAA